MEIKSYPAPVPILYRISHLKRKTYLRIQVFLLTDFVRYRNFHMQTPVLDVCTYSYIPAIRRKIALHIFQQRIYLILATCNSTEIAYGTFNIRIKCLFYIVRIERMSKYIHYFHQLMPHRVVYAVFGANFLYYFFQTSADTQQLRRISVHGYGGNRELQHLFVFLRNLISCHHTLQICQKGFVCLQFVFKDAYVLLYRILIFGLTF